MLTLEQLQLIKTDFAVALMDLAKVTTHRSGDNPENYTHPQIEFTFSHIVFQQVFIAAFDLQGSSDCIAYPFPGLFIWQLDHISEGHILYDSKALKEKLEQLSPSFLKAIDEYKTTQTDKIIRTYCRTLALDKLDILDEERAAIHKAYTIEINAALQTEPLEISNNLQYKDKTGIIDKTTKIFLIKHKACEFIHHSCPAPSVNSIFGSQQRLTVYNPSHRTKAAVTCTIQ